ncbi:uncharacterized protein EV420DRAFT_1649120 [Desarmillaria tabescens]|uniref:Uncharacterized protein n=1 Tax=Armillaria tabescens TaxID=1929756 RepID=A0AA39MR74_ARMTA|nr:uncharacterized protein EV420DRAFT_1649120 [Desarmillaria tabescens]KAK0443657.1 hypothetical protein EV420DRAFT_1649120 [Desarmillaria tabescens]
MLESRGGLWRTFQGMWERERAGEIEQDGRRKVEMPTADDEDDYCAPWTIDGRLECALNTPKIIAVRRLPPPPLPTAPRQTSGSTTPPCPPTNSKLMHLPFIDSSTVAQHISDPHPHRRRTPCAAILNQRSSGFGHNNHTPSLPYLRIHPIPIICRTSPVILGRIFMPFLETTNPFKPLLQLAALLTVLLLTLTSTSKDSEILLMNGTDYETDLSLIIAILIVLTILAIYQTAWSVVIIGLRED